MTKRIFRAIFIACLCVLGVAAIGTVSVMYQSFSQEQEEALLSQARTAAQLLEDEPDLNLSELKNKDIRLTLISKTGQLLYDSSSSKLSSSNHLDRQEIRQARENGEGFALRHSDTLLEDTYNAAVRLNNGSYLRLSRSHSSLLYLMGQALSMLAGFVLAAIALSWGLAAMLARSIVEPINAIDPNHPLESVPYDQLLPLQQKLEENRKQIRSQIARLEQQKKEFDLLSSNMEEGLLLIGANGEILTCNQVMQNLFDLRPGMRRSSLKDTPLEDLIEKAEKKGRSRLFLRDQNADYHIEAIRVKRDDNESGCLILALDVSEKEEIRRQREEFTANVTHELKTPLQTILSSSELLENNLVGQEDIPVFAGYIHDEAKRMSRMISEIIHLSRLDLSGPDAESSCRLNEIIEQTVSQAKPAAAMKHISIETSLEAIQASISPAIAQDLVTGLIENAILYNKDNGSVKIGLHHKDRQIIIEVCDTGIGIDPSLQNRIFERFFTADPSRSKNGTGLGLAIVKHAALLCGGSVEVASSLNQGSCFTIRLPDSLIESSEKTDK